MATNRFQFSLVGLMLLVVASAIACAALRFASELWASTVLTLTIAVLFVVGVGALYSREAVRAFRVGFLLFGWSYVGLVFGPGFDASIGSRLLTTQLLTALHMKLLDQPIPNGIISTVSSSSSNGVYTVGCFMEFSKPAGASTSGLDIATWLRFLHVGHSILALVFALIGGVLARHLWSRSRQPAAEIHQVVSTDDAVRAPHICGEPILASTEAHDSYAGVR